MGGGGGGGNNSQMMMTMIMMQQMQQQAEQQRQELARQQAANEKRYADSSRARYNTALAKDNKDLQAQYDIYNKNIDDTLKIDPTFSAGKHQDFVGYSAPQGFDQMDVNSVDNLYGTLDSKAFDDLTAFKKQVDQSNVWLNAAKQNQDILSRNMPGSPVGGWSAGGGGQMVSGGAGADSLTPNGNGTNQAATGLINDKVAGPNLAGMFGSAVSDSSKSSGGGSGKTIF